MASVFLFLANFIVRYFYIFLLLEPQNYIKYLPGHNNSRAEAFAMGKKIFYPDIWSSFYIFVGSVYKVLMSLNLYDLKIYAVVVINILLSSLSVVFLYKISKKLFSNQIAIIISIIFIFYYPTIYLNSLIMSENIFIPALLGFVYIYLFNCIGINYLWAGILLGTALLCRPILFTFVPFLILWAIIFKRKNQLLILLPTIVVIIAAGLINRQVSTDHAFSIGTNGGVNFAMTQCRFKKLQYNGPNKAKFYFTPPIFWGTDNQEKYTNIPFTNQSYYYKIGLQCLIDNPKRLISNLSYIKNIFISLYYPNFPKNDLHKVQLTIWKWIGIIFYILFLMYFLVKKNNRNIPIYVFFIFLFLSLILAVYFANPGEERYLASYFFAIEMFAVPTFVLLIKKTGLYQGVGRMKGKINQL